MLTYKALAALLDYPTEATIGFLPDLGAILSEEGALPGELTGGVGQLVAHLALGDLLDRQAEWVDQFDRSRSLSLNLFEHVHGDSRDRGQAMVDLQAMYTARGLDVTSGELPDYLPAFLEFLSMLPDEEAAELLGEAGHVVAVLADRLKARGSRYAPAMAAVAHMAGVTAPAAETVFTPDEDGDMDTAWAEDPIEFGAGAALPACGSASASLIRSEGLAR